MYEIWERKAGKWYTYILVNDEKEGILKRES